KHRSTRMRQPTNAAIPSSAPPMPTRRRSSLSSILARSSSALNSLETSLMARDTRLPMDWSWVPSALDLAAGSAITLPFSCCRNKSRSCPIATFAPHPLWRGGTMIAGDSSPDAETLQIREGKTRTAPQYGAPPPATSSPGYQACTFLCRAGPPSALLPSLPARHASRGWSRVGTRLPCPDLLSVRPFYDGSAAL